MLEFVRYTTFVIIIIIIITSHLGQLSLLPSAGYETSISQGAVGRPLWLGR